MKPATLNLHSSRAQMEKRCWNKQVLGNKILPLSECSLFSCSASIRSKSYLNRWVSSESSTSLLLNWAASLLLFPGENLTPAAKNFSSFAFLWYRLYTTVLSSNNHLKCLSRTTTKLCVNKQLIIYEYANVAIQGFAVAMITYPRGVNQIKRGFFSF